ncbi:2OG-Fe(II) oxygenase [Colwellia sp. 1_MG-2023]|uniref:2OG-Fe(II) oxygenase n=1 Tax=Colwellia sp. 1_MG-2023 TaxID=3062649 RepID=UPI0026E39846|nr:2OG-Fe(II) oxygenase [Colwellia sp. 1_MG-2023]MDO6445423.1 2OG-Fe(II) oxygenase [Colwellia sp. 1_MG-2023]
MSRSFQEVKRKEVSGVPGAFILENVFSTDEIEKFIKVSESLQYQADAAVSLPRNVRHNDNVTWVVDEETDQIIWDRVGTLINSNTKIFNDKSAVGINARFRFYRYKDGDYFDFHTDGSWPGSRVVNETLIHNHYLNQWSQMTFLILLSENFEGGATQFLTDNNSSPAPTRKLHDAKVNSVRMSAGSVLCFPHGNHPLHCLHASEQVTKGVKYIIRTDVLFEL